MVLKPLSFLSGFNSMFYSSVILNGTETSQAWGGATTEFYSSVILNGTETSNMPS